MFDQSGFNDQTVLLQYIFQINETPNDEHVEKSQQNKNDSAGYPHMSQHKRNYGICLYQ